MVLLWHVGTSAPSLPTQPPPSAVLLALQTAAAHKERGGLGDRYLINLWRETSEQEKQQALFFFFKGKK